MPVRTAVATDLDQICAMIAELAEFEESADEVDLDPDEVGRHLFGTDPAAHVLIAEPASEPGTTAGMALWYRTFSTWVGQPGIWLEDLFVRPAFRHQGLAGELLAELARLTDGRVEWAVLDWNRDAMTFYDGLGARPVDGWTRYRWLPTASDGPHGH